MIFILGVLEQMVWKWEDWMWGEVERKGNTYIFWRRIRVQELVLWILYMACPIRHRGLWKLQCKQSPCQTLFITGEGSEGVCWRWLLQQQPAQRMWKMFLAHFTPECLIKMKCAAPCHWVSSSNSFIHDNLDHVCSPGMHWFFWYSLQTKITDTWNHSNGCVWRKAYVLI